jgi:hypothetical protein
VIDSCCGVDPGAATGICFLDYSGGQLVGRTLLTTDAASAPVVLKGLLYAYYGGMKEGTSISEWLKQPVTGRRVGSVEKFVTGAGAGSRGKNADVTRQLVMELAEVLQLFGYQVRIRPAADVKPWASDKRLIAAGVGTKEYVARADFRHQVDASRHCLYGAHEAGVVADPLLRKKAS